jgi:hypothetical protein
MPKVNDPTLAAMDAIAHQEFRVRIGIMNIREYKIWAHDEDDAVEKVKQGFGTMSSQSQPEVVSVQVGQAGGGAITEEQAKAAARIVENAQAQKNPNLNSMAEFNKVREEN